jgi:hypothetical protein
LGQFKPFLSWFGRKPLLRNNKRWKPTPFLFTGNGVIAMRQQALFDVSGAL